MPSEFPPSQAPRKSVSMNALALNHQAELLGGVILIGIGGKILLEHLFGS